MNYAIDPDFDGIPVSLFFELSVAEDAAPVGYHDDDTPCYAFKGRCPKGGIARTPDGSPVLDLSKPENLAAFREYIDDLEPAPMPKRLANGAPQTALRWFEENMVGKTFSFDLPGIGLKQFHVKEGHLFRLVCETPPKDCSLRKGMTRGATSAEHARQMIREGKVLPEDCAGWNEHRAKSLPLIPVVLTECDAVLREREHPGFLTFVKKFISENGGVNTVVFRINEDGVSLGPMSAHMKGLTTTWLKKQDLTAVPATRSFGTGLTNSTANQERRRVACAENNSQPNGDIVANRRGEVNGVGEKKPTEDSLPFDSRAFTDFLANS